MVHVQSHCKGGFGEQWQNSSKVAPQPASSAFDGWAVSTTDTTDNTSAVAIIENVAFKDPDIVFSSNVERR